MSDKTSQRTEEEMLDQTFGNFDEEMTAQTEDAQTVASNTPTEKKKSSNAILFGGVGIAAVAVIGFMYVKGHNAAPVPVSAPVVNNAPINPPVQNTLPLPTTTPVATPPVAVTQPDVTLPSSNQVGNGNVPIQNAQNTQPADPAATNFLSDQTKNPLIGNNSVNPSNPVVNGNIPVTVNAPSDITNQPNLVNPNNNIPVITPVVNNGNVNTNNVNGLGNNVVQQALVDQLKQMFEQQTKEIKASVEQVGSRVTDLEKAIADQKDVNKSIEERLAKLEAGKSTKSTSDSNVNNSNKSNGDKSVAVVAKPKKTYHRHIMVARRTPVRESYNDRDVLVDKSSDTITPSPSVNTEPAYSEIQIHSVYAGRVWTKNKDGSLSTYSAGDRLPSGELIKRIDDEKAEIVTNKRVIK